MSEDFPKENTSQRKNRKNKIVIIDATFDLCTLLGTLKIMAKYRIKMERTQRGKKLDWKEIIIVECSIPPKIGEGKALMVDPPIFETIVSVEKIT